MTTNETNALASDDSPELIKEARLWQNEVWTARVIKNEDDEGWAVEMIKSGESEPALVGPWTMGRDKKNPKPLDSSAFNTLVKTASEFRQRQEQQQHATLHQSITINSESGRISVNLDIVDDEADPCALLTAVDANDEVLAQIRVSVGFKLNKASATNWIDKGFRQP